MAEKIRIAELNIDDKALLKSLTDTKKAIQDVSDAQKVLKITGEENSEQFVKNEAKLKNLKGTYSQQIKVLQATSKSSTELNSALQKEIKSVDDAAANNKELRQVRNQLNATTEEGAQAIADINAKIDKNTDFIKDNSSALEKQKQNIGNYSSAINKAKLGAVAFGAALKAAGIGLIVAAVGKLSAAFSRNQKVMDTVNTVANAIGIVFDKIVGTLVNTFVAVKNATNGFDALLTVGKNLVNIVTTPLQLAFQGIKAGILGAQLAWEKSFFGDKDPKTIKELETSLGETTDKIKQIGKDALASGKAVVNNFGEAVREVGALGGAIAANISALDFSTVLRDAAAITQYEKSLESLIATQENLVKQRQAEAELLRQTRDNTELDIETRKKASEDLLAALAAQEAQEKKLIGVKIQGQQLILAQNKEDAAAQAELIRLKGEVFDVEERLAGQRSEQQAAQLGLNREALDALKAFEDEKRALQDSIDEANLESEQAKEELRLEREYEKHVAELERLTLNEQQKADLLLLLEEDKRLQLAEITTKYNNKEAAADKDLQKQRIQNREETLDGILALAEAETGIGQAALIAKQVLALKEYAINLGLFQSKVALKTSEATADIAAGTAKSASAAPFPANIPLIVGFIASVAGLVGAIRSAGKKGKQKPKFATGGILSGPSHSAGGINTPYGELEGGEAVINKRSTALFGPILSRINEAGGGKKFAAGGILGSDSQAPNMGMNLDALAAKIAQANASLPAPRVSVEEISTVSSRVNVLESNSSF